MELAARPGQPVCVGIVEDDQTLGRLIGRALEQRGHRVWRSETVAAAIGMLVADPPLLLLLDLALPDGDGWQLLGQIERRPDQPAPRVIVMSSQRVSRAEQARRCLDGYLPKPVTIDAVLAAAEGLLTRLTNHR